MAPVNPELNHVQENVKNVIQDLYQVMGQVANYDSAGRPSKEALAHDLSTLDSSLQQVYRRATTSSSNSPLIPEPLIQYVENGRNPDIYTREFVELVRRLNQLARGKMHAFRTFRDVLAHEMDAALPELRDDTRRVVEATGGPGPTPPALGGLAVQGAGPATSGEGGVGAGQASGANT
ncbi:putative mediator of RNA polymerase II transcription subunit [Apodospora peruviana]|uniref:Mediator of RNA polymerase II transcription subunit 10 n=1 Tax=Apodospora peruviana TaxID=516989 RepID=A0AAE0ICF4_9PEZI|nr:putative mediator of RNA polymerase II transcription subunit [Apodospora peruviana]